MKKLSKLIPLINIWKWADGNEYTIDDDNSIIELSPELAQSSEKIEKEFEKHFTSEKSLEDKKRKFKVEKSELQKNNLDVQENKQKHLNKDEKVLGDE